VTSRVCLSAVLWREGSFAGNLRLGGLSLLIVLGLLALPPAHGQETETAVSPRIPLATDTPVVAGTGVARQQPDRRSPEQELTVESMVSYGDYRIFAAAERCNIWTSGVEYDRHMLGYHIGAQIDYVVEVLPFVLLSQPVNADFWGNPRSPYQELVPGLGISPIGFRLKWRSNRSIKPYLIAKGGAIAFTKKALSPSATYLNYNWQGELGVEFPLTDRVELRVAPIEIFHVSNGHLSGSNPGVDELSAKFGVSYHLGRRRGG
jgi:hypothetical protein